MIADRLHQQDVGQPRRDQAGAERILLDFLLHEHQNCRNGLGTRSGPGDDHEVRQHVEKEAGALYALEQPFDVDVGSIVIRPTAQG